MRMPTVQPVSIKEKANEIDTRFNCVTGAVCVTHVRGSEHELLPQGGMLQSQRLLQEGRQRDQVLPERGMLQVWYVLLEAPRVGPRGVRRRRSMPPPALVCLPSRPRAEKACSGS